MRKGVRKEGEVTPKWELIVTSHCVSIEELNLTLCLSQNKIWAQTPPLSPKGSPLLYFNEMSPQPQEHRRKSLIRDTYATPLEPVKQVPEELSVYFPQWQKQHILISYGVLNPTSPTNTSWQVIARYFPDRPRHRNLPSSLSLKGTRRKAELANRFPPHTVPSGVSARHT